MTRCIYCHLVKDLDSKGRCRSCANAGDATAYGLHYGEYMDYCRGNRFARAC